MNDDSIQAGRPEAPSPDGPDKAFATLRARAAMAGYTLGTVTEPDGSPMYVVSRWDVSRTLPHLSAVAAFLRKVGAPE